MAFTKQSMINKLGHFFNLCATDIKKYLSSETHNLILEISDNLLNEVYLDIKMAGLINERFIFTAYSHGQQNKLISLEPYLHTKSNLKPYKYSLFYTFSCLSGIDLGKKLIEEGCFAFLGYTVEACIVTFNEDIFMICTNHGLKEFMSGVNVSDSLKSMKLKHTEMIDKTYSKYPLVASTLRKNRDGLILHGNPDLKIVDLFQ